MRRILCVWLVLAGAIKTVPAADESPSEDARRAVAIAEFTRKTREANYPAKFEEAAREFNVPADVLKGIAFAETRWEHLTWPPGETASPDTGMSRPYGIMSLWDNDHFGHTLNEAAKLIGKDPEELKSDPLQNIRGAAALLRKLYDETARPDGTTEKDVESWRYAIRKYCGIPQPDLNARHALDIYTFMSRGYHQYGIEWDGRPVNLEPIRQETSRIVAEEQQKRATQSSSNTNGPATRSVPGLSANPATESEIQSRRMFSNPVTTNTPARRPAREVLRIQNVPWFVLGGMIALVVIVAVSGRRLK